MKFIALLFRGLFGITLSLSLPAWSQTTNQPVFLSPIMPDADVPVVLEWQSQMNAIYTVEYSVGLTNDWKPVETGFPSQGTTTRWSDHGETEIEQFRFSSADYSAPFRFYRLKVERLADTNLPISVTVTNITEGSNLSELAEIQGTAMASQGITSIKVLVDGFAVGKISGPNFAIPVETRLFANGPHRISAVAEDIGAVESAEEPNNYMGREASYGVTNINVTFSNTLSGARLRFEAIRPEMTYTQEVYALWSSYRNWRVDFTPKEDPATVYRSFAGTGTKILVVWDGKNSNGDLVSPQLLAAQIYDLGAATPPAPSGGGGGSGGSPPPMSMSRIGAGSPNRGTERIVRLPPLPWDPATWPTEEEKMIILAANEAAQPASRSTATWDSAVNAASKSGLGSQFGVVLNAVGSPFSLPFAFGYLGSIAIAGQGHHPTLGNYPTPPRISNGNVRMSSLREFGPWGRLKRVRGIIDDTSREFSRMGYAIIAKRLDDQVKPGDFLPNQPGSNTNIFSQANIGLFVGHSVAAKDAQSGFIWRQSYVPIYNSVVDSMTFVGSSSMNFGSEQLKWMSFFSCNMFRSGLYRTDGIYEQQKNFFALPMNGYLHIMQGFATENSIHPDMPLYWTLALRKSPLSGPLDQSVIGAWNFVCRRTQPAGTPTDPVNVARSVFWPECQGDFIFGYGPQTEPNRDPTDPLEQADLEEADEPANAPDP